MNAVTKPKATLLDLDALMDSKLDSVESLPDYMNPPPGLYVLTCVSGKIEKYDIKEEGNKTGEQGNRIKLTYRVDETKEVVAGEMAIPDGSLFTETFQGTEEGLKYCKKACMNILGIKDFEGASLGEILDGISNAQFNARITIRKSEPTPGKVYENVQIRAVG